MQTLARTAIARRPCVRSEAQLSEILAPWLTRQSVGPRRLRDPGPSTLELKLMLAAAGNVSDHGRLRPCRIAVVSGEQRERFAEAFLRYAASARGLPSLDALDEATQENECEKAFNAPCLLRLEFARFNVRSVSPWSLPFCSDSASGLAAAARSRAALLSLLRSLSPLTVLSRRSRPRMLRPSFEPS